MFVIFDLDGTLADMGKPTTSQNVILMHQLRDKGISIALSSGKPTFYLCGFARQLGLPDAILIGENGSVIQEGVSLPPPFYREAQIPSITRRALKQLREKLEEAFPDRIWYQPNSTALTPFPAYQEDFPLIQALLDDFITEEMNLAVYAHPDCFDITYNQLSKGAGIRWLSELTGVSPKDMIAVGDWTNDYPMFRQVGYSVGIHLPDPTQATVNFPSLTEALEHILSLIEP